MVEEIKVAYVFPGEESKAVGMGLDLYFHYSSARDVFDEVDNTLGFALGFVFRLAVAFGAFGLFGLGFLADHLAMDDFGQTERACSLVPVPQLLHMHDSLSPLQHIAVTLQRIRGFQRLV